MRIRDQIIFWMGVLVMVVVLNAMRSLLALNDTHRSEQRTREDYEVALNARNLRYLLSSYTHTGFREQVLPGVVDEQALKQYRRELIHQLEAGLGPGTDGFIREDFEELKSKAWRLLQMGDDFVDPEFQRLSNEAIRDSEALVLSTFDLVSRERRADERFFRYHFRLNIAILCVSLVLVFLILLLMRKRLFGPIQDLFAMLQRIRDGDLAVEWRGDPHDEIGELGMTVTQMSREIDSRRRERIDFVSSVTHDLKNPLSTIGLSSELALRDPSRLDAAQTASLFKTIKAQADRMRRLTDDLQEAVKGNRPFRIMQYSRFELDELARVTLKAFQNSYPTHEYQLELGKNPVAVFADPDRISQVLTNLLSNAVKYSRDDTLIEVWVGRYQDGACFEVRDRGIGIPDELKDRIFEAYLRLESGKQVSEGTGLGLAIVKDIVVSHGGTISVEGRAGGGSVFRVWLPESVSSTSDVPAA